MRKSEDEIKAIVDFILFLNENKNVICRWDTCDEEYLFDKSLWLKIPNYVGVDAQSEEGRLLIETISDSLNHFAKSKEEKRKLEDENVSKMLDKV